MTEQINHIPVVPLRGLTVFPGMAVHFDVIRMKSIEGIQQAMLAGQKVFLIRQKDEKVEEPDKDALCHGGVLAEIRQVVRVPQKGIRVMVYGEKRAILREFREANGFWEGDISIYPEKCPDLPEGVTLEGMKKVLTDALKQYAIRTKRVPEGVIQDILKIDDVYTMAAEAAAGIGLDSASLQKLLDEDSLLERFYLLAAKIEEETRAFDITAEIEKKVRERIDRGQREYILREQLKYIREELGEDGTTSDAEEFEKAEQKLLAPEEVHEKIKKEIRRFKQAVNNPTEAGVSRTYIETMLEMPWDKKKEESYDLSYAKEVLEKEHYGLEEVKERVLEYLAVRTLTQKGNTPILCLIGPPGTGKTSIARSLAKALHKPYVRISLGGVKDEAEIRGHRKTYVGAMPGRIANGLKTAGVKNPLMLLDEIDKASSDYKGDTFSALLEVLDSEQNYKFRDHYLEVPVDLSEVLFVTTANSLQTIPRPLLDRMEIIEISSYTENEKMHIADRHLIPKQLERHGLSEEQLQISKNAVGKMIRSYTKEAGVRQLERKIGAICRKSAKEILEKDRKKIRVTEKNIEKVSWKRNLHV